MSKVNKELEVADFVNENSAVNEIQEETKMVEKKNIVAKFKGLKTWQKAAIIAVGVAGVGLGGKVIFDVVSKNHEVVTDAVELAADVAEEAGIEVTTF